MHLDPRHPLAAVCADRGLGDSPLAFTADVEDGRAKAVQVRPRTADLPVGLTFADDRVAVRARFGPP